MRIRNENTVLRTHCDDFDGFMWIDNMNSLRKILGKKQGKNTYIKFILPNYPGIQYTCVRRDRSYKRAKYEFASNELTVTDYGNANLDPRKINVVFTDAPKSAVYGNRIRFLGCYKLQEAEGNKYTYELISDRFELDLDQAALAA